MPLRHLVLMALLLAGASAGRPSGPLPRPGRGQSAECSGTRAPMLFGLLARPRTLAEMVTQLERGCLVLDDVRFRPGGHTIKVFSPSAFAQVARALGLAQGAYRVAVPAEATAGWPPDTVQARRRGAELRDELVHHGASLERLLEEPGFPVMPFAVGRGAAIPMLLRVHDFQD